MPKVNGRTLADVGDWLAAHGPVVVLIIVGAYLVLRLGRVLTHRLVERTLSRQATDNTTQELSAVELKKRVDTLEALGTRVLRLVVVVAATFLVFDTLDLLPALAGLGLLGAALAFAFQDVIRDLVNGALIVIENWYSIGDVVTVGGVSGTVEDIGLRRTTLRDLDGVVHIVPNGEIRVASNLTRVWARINLDVTVAHGTDLDRASAVVDAVGREMAGEATWKRRLLEPPRVERVEAIGEYGITLKILGTVRASDRWAASGELRKRLLVAFREHGIELPRPQRVVLVRDPGGPVSAADLAPGEDGGPAGESGPAGDGAAG